MWKPQTESTSDSSSSRTAPGKPTEQQHHKNDDKLMQDSAIDSGFMSAEHLSSSDFHSYNDDVDDEPAVRTHPKAQQPLSDQSCPDASKKPTSASCFTDSGLVEDVDQSSDMFLEERVDSILADRLSCLKLQPINDLSGKQQTHGSRTFVIPEQIAPWEQCFYQDDSGDT